MNSAAGFLMVGAGAGGGDRNGCAVCVLKWKCPLLWVSRYTRNYAKDGKLYIYINVKMGSQLVPTEVYSF